MLSVEDCLKSVGDIEAVLGCRIESDPVTLLAAYNQALQSGVHAPSVLKVAYKIASDPYYRDAFCQYGSLSSLIEAGFFDDGLEPGVLQTFADTHWLTTPLEKIIQNIDGLVSDRASYKGPNPLVVLLSTGGFAPLHDGHVQMMEIARESITALGYNVVGGFLSPSHDTYVGTKCETMKDYTAATRVRLGQEALEDHKWLCIDPWESLYTPSAILFTDVILRLKAYLEKHLPLHQFEVAYVFGADNAFFARAFHRRGIGVCVSRPGYEHLVDKVRSELPETLSNTVFAPLEDSSLRTADISSRQLRKLVGTYASSFPADSTGNRRLENSPVYLLRNDLLWATKGWECLADSNNLKKANCLFVDGLKTALKSAFQEPEPRPEFVTVDVDAQDKIVQSLSKSSVLNLDMVTAKTDCGFSRLFALCDGQLKEKGIIQRPGSSMAPSDRFARLPEGDYLLIDDDIATGSTMRAIEKMLPEHIRIRQRISLLNESIEREQIQGRNILDIIDARDHLIGSNASGLVCRLFNGEIIRVPYLPPYISLSARVSIPANQAIPAAYKILELNLAFHELLSCKIPVRLADESFQKFVYYLGFTSDTPLTDVIRWHLERLKPLLPSTCLVDSEAIANASST